MKSISGTSTILFLLTLTPLALTSVEAEGCKFDVVESMPEGMKFDESIPMKVSSTEDTLIDMIKNAKRNIKLASFYVYLTAPPEFANDPSAEAGRNIMTGLQDAVGRGVKLDVVLDNSTRSFSSMNNQIDIQKLQEIGTVKFLNLRKLLHSGVMHSKFIIIDDETFYMGSSNFDWRSYTQIKEIGIAFYECPVIAQDIAKIFETYQIVADSDTIVPEIFPESVYTSYNIDHPLEMKLGNLDANIFLGAAPPAFNGIKEWTGRTSDIDGLLHVIDTAEKFVDISVMNYSPTTYGYAGHRTYWPKIDDALRRAVVERQVRVRLLVSDWPGTSEEQLAWYKSLNDINSKSFGHGGIQVRLFKVPSDDHQSKIPYARVKHDKYMVTDKSLFIGTSNWSADYFITTCGVSFVVSPRNGHVDDSSVNIINGITKLFNRDFESSYARDL